VGRGAVWDGYEYIHYGEVGRGKNAGFPPPQSGRTVARFGLRIMPTFPRSPLSFRTVGFPQYGWKVGISGGAFPGRQYTA
jgi:hypothetical protein